MAPTAQGGSRVMRRPMRGVGAAAPSGSPTCQPSKMARHHVGFQAQASRRRRPPRKPARGSNCRRSAPRHACRTRCRHTWCCRAGRRRSRLFGPRGARLVTGRLQPSAQLPLCRYWPRSYHQRWRTGGAAVWARNRVCNRHPGAHSGGPAADARRSLGMPSHATGRREQECTLGPRKRGTEHQSTVHAVSGGVSGCGSWAIFAEVHVSHARDTSHTGHTLSIGWAICFLS
eukprot:357080-Chlamydomonas_euryale.AAC.3